MRPASWGGLPDVLVTDRLAGFERRLKNAKQICKELKRDTIIHVRSAVMQSRHVANSQYERLNGTCRIA